MKNNRVGRPVKYKNSEQRHAAIKARTKIKDARRPKRIAGRYFRLVVPALSGHPADWTWTTPSIAKLRAGAVDRLVARQRPRGLESYLVSVQRHAGSGLPHLDVLIVYSRQVKNSPTHYDYVLKHGDLKKYRSVNAAILDYGRKEDPNPLGDLDTARVVAESRVKTDLYSMMEAAMLQRPFEFDPIAWLADSSLMAAASRTNVYKTIRLVKDRQNLECNRRLTRLPGFMPITRELIQARLSPDELALYDSWPGYGVIVAHLNQIPRWGCRRPHKTSNLFLYGPPNTGKSTLICAVSRWVATYPLGIKGGWWPEYMTGVYGLLSWDEFSLRIYSYPDLLKLLEGAPMKLPQKGGHVGRDDNQLTIATSNLSIRQHVESRFGSASNRAHSLANLGARFAEVRVPADRPLFLLLKLISPMPPVSR